MKVIIEDDQKYIWIRQAWKFWNEGKINDYGLKSILFEIINTNKFPRLLNIESTFQEES